MRLVDFMCEVLWMLGLMRLAMRTVVSRRSGCWRAHDWYWWMLVPEEYKSLRRDGSGWPISRDRKKFLHPAVSSVTVTISIRFAFAFKMYTIIWQQWQCFTRWIVCFIHTWLYPVMIHPTCKVYSIYANFMSSCVHKMSFQSGRTRLVYYRTCNSWYNCSLLSPPPPPNYHLKAKHCPLGWQRRNPTPG